jgi:hypothetical protein
MDRVFVVMGEAGEYSDHSEWPVRAFATHAEAKAFMDECEAYAKTKPKRPSYPAFRYHGLGEKETTKEAAERQRFNEAMARYEERRLVWAGAAPDPSMPSSDDADYHVQELPFGRDSAALETAPPRVRSGAGRLFTFE